MNRKVIRARRKAIQADARCEGCGSTLSSCKAQRGKDPTAPPWFGCCAQGLDFRPCSHHVDAGALLSLLKEIERGKVRDPDQMLLDAIEEYPSTLRRRVLASLPEEWDGR